MSETQEIVQGILNSDFTGTTPNLHDIEELFVRKFPSLYCLKYKPIKSRPLTFKSKYDARRHRHWQVKILDDPHPDKVIEKSRQLGLSELGVSEVVWFLDTRKDTKAMYTFPRDSQMKDFSNTRIAPVFRESEYLSSLLSKEANNVALKKIGSSWLFLRSAWGSALGEGADIDFLGFDEYDRMADGVEFAFQESLKSSKYGWLRRWSTPTLPGRGVNRIYSTSDQMRYFWTCPHCGHKQFLTFADNVIQIKPNGINIVEQTIEDGTYIIGCAKCKKELDRWGEGQWEALYPSRKDVRGYHISQLDAVWISADDIMRRQFKYTSKQLFHNYVIGDPFSSEGMVIEETDVRESIRMTSEVYSRTSMYTSISVGIDWGQVSWMCIGGRKSDGSIDLLGIYWFEDNPIKPLEAVAQFASVLKAYTPTRIVADAGYGADKNSFMFTQFPLAFYSCYWKTIKDSKTRVQFKSVWNNTNHEVTVDKTTQIQRMLHKVKGRSIGMFPWSEKMAMLTKHLKNVRIMDEEDDGIIYQVATRIGPDHLACALTYMLIGFDGITNMDTAGGMSFEFI